MKQPPISNDYILNRVRKTTQETTKSPQADRPQGPSFDQILDRMQRKQEGIKISKHAAQRLDERNIILTDADMKALESALDQAKAKGVREALILNERTAFIASVTNRTIVTAVTEDQLKDNVFTNIDGAVIL